MVAIIVNLSRMLKPRHRHALDLLLPSGGEPTLPGGAFDTGFDEFHEDFRRSAPAPMRLAFAAALEIAVWVAPLLIGRPGPLYRLSAEDGTRALEALGSSRFYLLRQQFLLLKSVLCLHYGALPQTRRALGYPA
jgi:hypothetical protein